MDDALNPYKINVSEIEGAFKSLLLRSYFWLKNPYKSAVLGVLFLFVKSIKELKEFEFIANGVLIENESIERMESDRRKRLLATSFVAVRNMTGMNRKEFAEWLAIPYRTMQDWELGTSQVPEYVLRLVAYKVLMEKKRGNL